MWKISKGRSLQYIYAVVVVNVTCKKICICPTYLYWYLSIYVPLTISTYPSINLSLSYYLFCLFTIDIHVKLSGEKGYSHFHLCHWVCIPYKTMQIVQNKHVTVSNGMIACNTSSYTVLLIILQKNCCP